MAKKATSKASTRKKSTKKSTSKSNQNSNNRKLGGVVTIIVLLLALYFVFTGSDPFGMFEVEETPQTGEGQSDSAWWQVYFTDPSRINDPENLRGSIPEKLIEHIDNAQESIHIAAFEFNLTPVAEALVRAHERGVDVKWITDDEHGIEADEEDDHGQFALLEGAGIEVRDDGRGALMHDKFFIFDNNIVWTGSTNITRNGNFRNNNNVIVIESPQLAAIFEREFQEMWDGEFGPRSPSTVGQQKVTIQGTPVQALFAAEDEVVTELLPLIENAQKSIHFMAFSFTHDAVETAMMARYEDGVTVTGIFETRGSETEYSALPKMYCAGAPVRQDGNPGTFHHKVIVIDERLVITGSLNFSENADDSNDENVLIIDNPEIARLYIQEFERRWAEAESPDAADMDC